VTHVRTIAAAVLATVLAAPAGAAETARQILDRRKALEDTTRHWHDRYEKMKFRIVDRRGGERTRELELYDIRLPGDEGKTILFFLSPAEVKGTGFLAFNHKGHPADQWLYLPELKRVRQITARARSESFVGTDLSYHDLDLIQEMPSWSETDAASQLRNEETVDGIATHTIDLTPKREDIGWARITLWLGKDDLVPHRLEFYEAADGEPKKRIVQGDVRAVGAIPVAHRVTVATPGAGSHTEIEIADVRFDQGLTEDAFSHRYLELGRVD
jgi:outer membrane lipoprotein-sorting protein